LRSTDVFDYSLHTDLAITQSAQDFQPERMRHRLQRARGGLDIGGTYQQLIAINRGYNLSFHLRNCITNR